MYNVEPSAEPAEEEDDPWSDDDLDDDMLSRVEEVASQWNSAASSAGSPAYTQSKPASFSADQSFTATQLAQNSKVRPTKLA